MDWNATSQTRISGVDPRLVKILQITRQRTGIPFEISEGMRTAEKQREYVAAGKSQTQNSKHLHGNALDIFIPGADGKADYDFEHYRPIADEAKRVASELGYDDFVWGGDWKSLRDGVHFQIGGNHTGSAPAAPAMQQGGQPYQSAAPGPQMAPTNVLAGAQSPEAQQWRYNALQLDPASFMNRGF
jgi:peptidoglycan L-alanyl-D-glutamate endopeptidase CwlK